MIVYRIARTEYCDTSGEGAKIYGGRWNLPGYPVLYGCSTIASALLERLTVDPELFASERYVIYRIMEFNCPDKLIVKPDLNELPANWDSIPFNNATQEFGAKLIQSGVVCFAFPSVVDKTSFNFVINPLSGDFKKLIWKTYLLKLDKRIIR